MDIKETITEFQNRNTSGMDRLGLNSFIEEIRQQENNLRQAISDFQNIRSEAQNLIWEMDRQEQEKKNQESQTKMAERGYTIGAVFYIDRHDGVYVVKGVDQHHISFERKLEGKSWGKTNHMQHDRIDPRLTPLRTQGPFRVGETVVRNETEYTVEGYLGYRMLLSSGGIWGKTYQIVQKKDEKTYRSIII